jgi:hypothetical protein
MCCAINSFFAPYIARDRFPAVAKSRRISQLKFLAGGGASSRYIFMLGFY